ncbi:MAG TPA: winged helix-turn-helix domain-containing protein [Polyangiaceae bacterium]|nr:winged helix-turn-helix domain-containing protein [Polyangiaceae bacterium]
METAMVMVVSTMCGEVFWVDGQAGAPLTTTMEALRDFEIRHIRELRSASRQETSWAARVPDLYFLVGDVVSEQAIIDLRVRAAEMPLYVVASALSQSRPEEALLEAGADGCSFLPLPTSILSARVRALMRRRSTPPRMVAEVRIDPSTRELHLPCGQRIHLSESECRLVQFLALRPGTWISRDEILAKVFSTLPRYDSSLLRTHVWNLRRKLGSSRWLLRSDRAKGVMLGVSLLPSGIELACAHS